MEDTAPISPVHQELAALRHQVARLEAALAAQQHDAQALRDTTDYAAKIVETSRDPLLVLTADLRVRWANPPFYQTFQVRPVETEGQHLYQLGNGQWDIPALRTLLEELLPRNHCRIMCLRPMG
jgi:PAS domain-containing protein